MLVITRMYDQMPNCAAPIVFFDGIQSFAAGPAMGHLALTA